MDSYIKEDSDLVDREGTKLLLQKLHPDTLALIVGEFIERDKIVELILDQIKTSEQEELFRERVEILFHLEYYRVMEKRHKSMISLHFKKTKKQANQEKEIEL